MRGGCMMLLAVAGLCLLAAATKTAADAVDTKMKAVEGPTVDLAAASQANDNVAAAKPSEANDDVAAAKPNEANDDVAAAKPNEANDDVAAAKPTADNYNYGYYGYEEYDGYQQYDGYSYDGYQQNGGYGGYGGQHGGDFMHYAAEHMPYARHCAVCCPTTQTNKTDTQNILQPNTPVTAKISCPVENATDPNYHFTCKKDRTPSYQYGGTCKLECINPADYNLVTPIETTYQTGCGDEVSTSCTYIANNIVTSDGGSVTYSSSCKVTAIAYCCKPLCRSHPHHKPSYGYDNYNSYNKYDSKYGSNKYGRSDSSSKQGKSKSGHR